MACDGARQTRRPDPDPRAPGPTVSPAGAVATAAASATAAPAAATAAAAAGTAAADATTAPAAATAAAAPATPAPVRSGFARFDDFPFADPIAGGRFVATRAYLGGTVDKLYFGHAPASPGARYLLSVTTDNGLALEELQRDLLRAAPGVFRPMFIGHFDRVGDSPVRDNHRTQTCVFVEELPDGEPLRRAVAEVRPVATSLGAQLARLLAHAHDVSGVVVDGLRPEYIWVAADGPRPRVTGVGGRNHAFFASARRRRDVNGIPLFTHQYLAPEILGRQPVDGRASVFTVAVMVAEWATGTYPFRLSEGAWGISALRAGRHLPLLVRPALADLLSTALRPDPADRPDLRTFADLLDEVGDRG